MRILIVTPFKGKAGGVESYTAQLEEVLVELGHVVSYITAENGGNCLFARIANKLFGAPSLTAIRFKRLKEKFDLIICNGEFGLGITHPHCINIFHGSFYGYRKSRMNKFIPWLSLTWQGIIQTFAAKNKYVVAVSDFLIPILESQQIQVSNTLPPFIELAKEERARNGKCLFIGRHDYLGKGFDVFEKLQSMGLVIDVISNQDVGGTLNWLGDLDREAVLNLYQEYSLLIFPSRFESFGLVPLEAMMSGMHILMNNVGIGTTLKKENPECVFDIHNDSIESIFDRANELLNSGEAPEYQLLVEHSKEAFKQRIKSIIEKVGPKCGN